MLAPANVTKLECKVVVDILDYFKCKKTIIKPGLSKVRASVFLYASYLAECLTDSQECEINEIVLDPCSPTTPLTCDDQLTVTITESTRTCTFKATLDTPYPSYVLTQGSQYVNAKTTLKHQESCSPIPPYSDEEIVGGCNSTTCSTAQQGSMTLNHLVPFPQLPGFYFGTSYISNIRLYYTDSLGEITTYEDWNLDHTSSIYTAAACPTCVNVTTSNTLLGNSNFATSFTALLGNIAKIKFGDNTNRHTIQPSYSSGNINFFQTVKHKVPNSMGIHIGRIVLKDLGSGLSITLEENGLGIGRIVSQTPIQFHYTSSPKNSNCGTFSPRVHNQQVALAYNISNVSFNSFGLPNLSPTPLTLTNNVLSCTRYVFCHKADALGPLATQQWSLSWTPAITNELCVYASNIGEYYSYTCTESGCCESITKEVTEHPPLTITANDIGITS